VNLAAKQQVEAGSPAVAMEWLATLPFANQNDYSKALGNVFEVWKIKSPTDAATWLQTANRDDPIRSELLRGMEP